jgi:hypothetical protein
MDYKIQSHDLGNLPHTYYYIKKVLQCVRLVINIRVKERVYSIFKNKVHIVLVQQDAWYKTWYIHGVLYTILMLWNSCSVGYLLSSLETLHSTTTEKSIRLFTDVAIHEVAWYVIKQEDDAAKQLYYPTKTNIHSVTNNKNIHPILRTLYMIIRRPLHFLDDESGKIFVLYLSKYSTWWFTY